MNKFIDVDKMGSHYLGLDSAFLYVKDLGDSTGGLGMDEGMPKMNVWILENEEKADLLKIALRPEDIMNTCAIIVLDLE